MEIAALSLGLIASLFLGVGSSIQVRQDYRNKKNDFSQRARRGDLTSGETVTLPIYIVCARFIFKYEIFQTWGLYMLGSLLAFFAVLLALL
jgi:hypothetical protein